jgi:hypothetical protein
MPNLSESMAQPGMMAGSYPTGAETITVELRVAAELLAKTVAALNDDQLARPIYYPYPR